MLGESSAVGWRRSLIFRGAVLARCGVQAGIRQAQPLHRTTADDMRLHNLVDVRFGNVPVPDCFGVDHDIRPVFALVEAAGLVGSHFALQSVLGKLLFKELLQLRLRHGITTPPWMSRRSLVSANEDMFFKLWHHATTVISGAIGAPNSASQIPSKSTK